jgi:hypothetical protein
MFGIAARAEQLYDDGTLHLQHRQNLVEEGRRCPFVNRAREAHWTCFGKVESSL